jgi:hypothetical protein
MMGANGTGPTTTIVSRERDFEIFDSLPECVRQALNFAMFKYVAAEVAITVRQFGPEKIAAALPLSDQRMLEKERTGIPLAPARRRPRKDPWHDWTP